jgi:hypothetical protein
MWIAKCDRCGNQSSPMSKMNIMDMQRREGWRELFVVGSLETYPPKILCPACAMLLGMTGEKQGEKSVGERLVEILEEIAEGVQE